MEPKIRALCEQMIACKEDGQCYAIAQQLRAALHEHIEKIRGTVVVMPSNNSDQLLAS